MRQQFIACRTLRTAKRRAPWAAIYRKACDGWWAYESVVDARIAENQV